MLYSLVFIVVFNNGVISFVEDTYNTREECHSAISDIENTLKPKYIPYIKGYSSTCKLKMFWLV